MCTTTARTDVIVISVFAAMMLISVGALIWAANRKAGEAMKDLSNPARVKTDIKEITSYMWMAVSSAVALGASIVLLVKR